MLNTFRNQQPVEVFEEIISNCYVFLESISGLGIGDVTWHFLWVKWNKICKYCYILLRIFFLKIMGKSNKNNPVKYPYL